MSDRPDVFPTPRTTDCAYGCCKAGDIGISSEVCSVASWAKHLYPKLPAIDSDAWFDVEMSDSLSRKLQAGVDQVIKDAFVAGRTVAVGDYSIEADLERAPIVKYGMPVIVSDLCPPDLAMAIGRAYDLPHGAIVIPRTAWRIIDTGWWRRFSEQLQALTARRFP